MTYLTFCKNIFLHPIAFLDEYFVSGKTPEEYKKKTWFLIFKLWAYLFFTFTLIVAIIGFFFLGPFALLFLLLPLICTTIQYTFLRLGQWLYYKCTQWAGLALTKEKAKNLYDYVVLYSIIIGLVGGIIQFSLSLLIPVNAFGFVDTVYDILLMLYVLYIAYKFANKVTGISLLRYILYFIVLPIAIIIAITLIAIIAIGMVIFVLLFFFNMSFSEGIAFFSQYLAQFS